MFIITYNLEEFEDLFIHKEEFFDPENDVEITDRKELISEIERLKKCAITLMHYEDFQKSKDFLDQIIVYQKKVDEIDIEYNKSF